MFQNSYILQKIITKNKFKIINNISKKFKKKIIIRSASYEEDSKSNAGKFLSMQNICSKNLIS